MQWNLLSNHHTAFKKMNEKCSFPEAETFNMLSLKQISNFILSNQYFKTNVLNWFQFLQNIHLFVFDFVKYFFLHFNIAILF